MSQLAGTTSPSSASSASAGLARRPPSRTRQNQLPHVSVLPPKETPSATPNWIERWPDIHAKINARPRLLLALGFDGILSPTVLRPDQAILPEKTHALLAALSATPRMTLAFLSGRSRQDVQARVALQAAYYAGNHGMEIRGPGLTSSDGLAVSCRSDLVDALAFLTRCTKRLKGVLIEDKGLTVSVHWRLADPGEGEILRNLMDVIVQNHPRLRVFAGEVSWELRARASWNKGDALEQVLTHLQLTPADTIYIGGEFTDEDAFARLSEGLTFCVGETASTAAQYRLAGPTDATRVLSQILGAVNGGKPK